MEFATGTGDGAVDCWAVKSAASKKVGSITMKRNLETKSNGVRRVMTLHRIKRFWLTGKHAEDLGPSFATRFEPNRSDDSESENYRQGDVGGNPTGRHESNLGSDVLGAS